MKNIRTEVSISVRTFVGDDIGQEAPPLARLPEATEYVLIIRTSGLGPNVTVPETVNGHVVALLANAAHVLPEKLAHQTRHIPNT